MKMPPQLKKGLAWFASKGWTPCISIEAWERSTGNSRLVNAPTGIGTTFSLLVTILWKALAKKTQTTRLFGYTIRALGKDRYFCEEVI